MQARHSLSPGFSLIELSIVLVILGLLVGGILAGKSLIRASELRAVTSESQRYQTALNSFRDRYFGLPGDISNATAIWGRLSLTSCSTQSSAAVTDTGVCDGNSNGQVMHLSNANEAFLAWREMANAGLIEGSYSGLYGPGGIYDGVPGTNVPVSKLSNSSWYFGYWDNSAGSTSNAFWINYGNALMFGADNGNAYASSPSLLPEEAWNIDSKIDDGKPAYGKVMTLAFTNGSTSCITPNSGSLSGTNFDVSYKLTDNSLLCALVFKTGY